jgi:hypothetical protein
MAEDIRIVRQWNVKVAKLSPPKHGSRRVIAMTLPVRERLLTLPREAEWVFATLRGHHYTIRRQPETITGIGYGARWGSVTHRCT